MRNINTIIRNYNRDDINSLKSNSMLRVFRLPENIQTEDRCEVHQAAPRAAKALTIIPLT